jgi:hypothetical protein
MTQLRSSLLVQNELFKQWKSKLVACGAIQEEVVVAGLFKSLNGIEIRVKSHNRKLHGDRLKSHWLRAT